MDVGCLFTLLADTDTGDWQWTQRAVDLGPCLCKGNPYARKHPDYPSLGFVGRVGLGETRADLGFQGVA